MNLVNKSFRSLTLAALALLTSTAMIGCGGMEGEGEESIEIADSPLVTSSGPTLGSYSYQTLYDSAGKSSYRPWMTCGANQVVVGWHRAQQKVLCVNLPPNIQRVTTSLQLPYASAQVNGMQGCPGGQYIQGISNSSSTGYLYCAGFKNMTTGQPVLWTGVPQTDSGSQSNAVYGWSSPNMHVCPATSLGGGSWDSKAMVGLHIGNEYLACVK